MPLKERSGNPLREFININHELVNSQNYYMYRNWKKQSAEQRDIRLWIRQKEEDLVKCISWSKNFIISYGLLFERSKLDMSLYLNLAMTICALFGMTLGGIYYLAPRKPLYASMIVLGVACIALARFYQFARLVTGLENAGIFQLGVLGIVGTFAFFFSSNYGQIDSLVDDRSKEFFRYRLIAWIGPVVVLILFLFAAKDAFLSSKISYAMVSVAIGAASYFHVKHLLIPDVDYGVVHCLRRFNAVALLYGFLCMLEMIAMENYLEGMILVVGVLQCVVSILIVPTMDKGVKQWTS